MVPDLGEGLEELTIIEWFVQTGEQIELNQPLCSVETEKAVVEIPSPHEGILLTVGGGVGETLVVGSLLARFGTVGAPHSSTPAADDSNHVPRATLVGYGLDESIDRSRRRRVQPRSDVQPASAVALRPLAKPPVRQLAKTLDVDLGALAGSGPDGIITRDDVSRAATRSASGSPLVGGPEVDDRSREYTVIPVKGVRARIADRMSESRRHIPDATCTIVVDCTRLIEVRSLLNDAARGRGLEPQVTPFSLICRLAVSALAVSPTLNSTFVEASDEIRVYRDVHLGIGTATDRGLLVAVVRQANGRSTMDLSTEITRLTAEARAATLRPVDMSGSTFTVSNFGALGLDEGIPIINHPEAAILGVGSIKPRPHVVGDQVIARATGSFTLAFDHRVCDGSEAAAFLSELRALIEAPELALLGR